MPQPVRATLVKYHEIVGKVIHNHEIVEFHLVNAIRVLAKIDHKLATAIYYSFDSLPGRKRLLLKVCEVSGDARDKEITEAMIAAADKSNNQRKIFAHAVTFMEPNVEAKLVSFSGRMKREVITVDFLKTHLGESSVALTEIRQAFRLLCEKLGVPPELTL